MAQLHKFQAYAQYAENAPQRVDDVIERIGRLGVVKIPINEQV